MLQTTVHYGIHILVPLFVAFFFFKSKWKLVFLVMMLTFIIDGDHLFANPIFDPTRCSINFHPLHSYFAIALYLGMLFIDKFRILAIGLLIHILADAVDCLFM